MPGLIKRTIRFVCRRCDGCVFIKRLFLVCMATAFLSLVLTAIACMVDRFDVARRALSAFAPYSSSLPWMFVGLLAVVLLCHPAVSRWFKAIRELRIGAVALVCEPKIVFDEETTSRLEEIVQHAVAKQLVTGRFVETGSTSGSDKQSMNLMLAWKSTAEYPVGDKEDIAGLVQKWTTRDENELAVLHQHAARIGAKLINRNVRFKDGRFCFDGAFAKGGETILAEVKRASSLSKSFPSIKRAVESFSFGIDQLSKENAKEQSFHLLIDCENNEKPPKTELEQIRPLLDSVENSKLYLYNYRRSESHA